MAGNPKYQGEKIIKDYGKLSFDYVPEVLVHREAQLQRLQTIFKPVLHGVRRTALLLGSVGTGKTVTAKRFCQNITSEGTLAGINITSLLINCREKRSEHAVLHAINSFFNPGCPDRGLAPEEFLRSIRRSLEERKLHMIIVLDEADGILRRGADDLIYVLTRFNEEFCQDYSLSLILISQRYLLDQLDKSALSTFCKANIVSFERYDAAELRDIVLSRIDLAFYPGTVEEECIDLIAESSADWGDARFAMELLETSALIAEERRLSGVTPECVREAKNMTCSDGSYETKLSKMDYNHKLVLLSICRSIGRSAYTTSIATENAYKIASEECKTAAKGTTTFWKYLKDLAKDGWIEQKVITDPNGSGGRTTCIYISDFPIGELRYIIEKEFNLTI